MIRSIKSGLFLIFFLFGFSILVQAQTKPNVIIIFTDDQGTLDVGCYGASDLITPNMDRLAKEGVKFTRFYASSAICSPSRAALLTGRYPHRAGVPVLVKPSDPTTDMPSSEVTLAEMLKGAGYATAIIGKWHLGHSPQTKPSSQGFDHSFGHLGGCIDNYSHFFFWNGPNRHDLYRNDVEVWEDGRYFPDMLVEEAGAFMEKNKDKPFFIYWPINTPHYPLQAEEKWRDKYKHLPSPRDKYAAFVSTTDEKIGDLMKKMEDLDLKKNTIVVFMSDHGHSVEERTFGAGGYAGPYRGAKWSLFEGGIRVPAMISWPGKLPEGAVREQLATGTDWFPTILELCNVKLPDVKLDGKSLVPLIKNEKASSPHKSYHWALNNQWTVMEGDWKLIGNPTDPTKKYPLTEKDKLFLVNLKEDKEEKNNVAAQYPEIVKNLLKYHQDWLKELGSKAKQ